MNGKSAKSPLEIIYKSVNVSNQIELNDNENPLKSNEVLMFHIYINLNSSIIFPNQIIYPPVN
jgi:hypothetical protein